MTSYIDRTLVNQIMRHAQSSPEQEVCGLVGVKGRQGHVYPVANIASDPACLFAMDPQQQIAAMRQMREAGEHLFAIYHSHPGAPATPSRTDIEQAAYAEALYLIISLNTKGVLEMRGYRLQEQEFQPVELAILEEDVAD